MRGCKNFCLFEMRLSSLQALLIAFSLAGYPMVSTFSTALGFNGSMLAIGTRAVVLLLSFLLFFPLLSLLKKHQLKYLTVYGFFWLAYILRILADTSMESSQLARAASEYWIWAVGVCLIPSLGLLAVDVHTCLPKAFKLSWIALGVASLLAIFFGTTFVTRLDGTQSDTGRLALESLNPISAGHLGASLVIISCWFWWNAQRPTFLEKSCSVVCIFSGLYLLISAASRGPFLALVCVLIIVMLSLKLKQAIKLAMTIFLIAATLAPLVFRYVDFEAVQLVARIAASTSGEDQSVGSREGSLSGAWKQFSDNPLLGDFLDERSTGYYPHNLVLEAFMATGLSGGVALSILIFTALWKAYKMIRQRREYAWIGLLFIQYCVGAQMSGALYTSATFWSFSVLVIFAGKSQLTRLHGQPLVQNQPKDAASAL